MTSISWKNILIGITFILVLFAIIWIGAISYINNNPGYYKYTIDIDGLEQFQTGLVTDIIIPLPVRDSQQVFTDEELQYQSFGNWKSVLVMTPYGKMLAFQSIGRNLTDLHAEFSHKYPDGDRIKNITSDSLSPVLPYTSSPYTQWVYGSGSVQNYSTIIYIPDSLQPRDKVNDKMAVRIELIANGGMQHSVTDTTYRVTIQENIPPVARNMTPVIAQIGTLDARDLNSEYKWVPGPII
ncbi:hypothetical protein [Methanoregula sp.]|uniref:hypothetical protein n=1 Tax=Methanoregula sp. TaxID=2052170 RepID=UPI003D0C7ABB